MAPGLGFPALRWPSLSSVLAGVTGGAAQDAQAAVDTAAGIGGALADTGQRSSDLIRRIASGEINAGAFAKAAGSQAFGKVYDATRDAVTAPQRAYSGDLPIYDPTTGHTTQEAREAASGLAGLAMTGSLPFSVPKGALRSFGGAAAEHDPLAALEAALGDLKPAVPPGPRRLDPTAASWDLYHGSPAGPDFQRFDPQAGSIPAERGGVFFAPDGATASKYAESASSPGDAGARVFRATVEPGRTGVFDIGHLAATDPAFNAEARALTVAGNPAMGSLFDQHMAQHAATRARDAEIAQQLREMGLEPGPGEGSSYGFGHVGAAIRRAQAQGLDTAILRGLAEHGGDDQVVALTPGRVRSYYDPSQLLYSGGPGGAIGLATLGQPDDAQPAPAQQGKPPMSAGIGSLLPEDLARFFNGLLLGPAQSFAGTSGQIAPQQPQPGGAVPRPVPMPPRRPQSFEPPSAADMPAPDAVPTMVQPPAPQLPMQTPSATSADQPGFGDTFNNAYARSSDLLTSLGIGLMSRRGLGNGVSAGLQLAQAQEGKRAATDLARAEYGLKVNKLNREQQSENQTARLIAGKLGIPLDQATGLAGNTGFVSEFFKGNYGAPEGLQRNTDGSYSYIPGSDKDPTVVQRRAQAQAAGTAAGTGDQYNLTDAPDGSKIAVNKSDPTDVKIVQAGQPPRPLTDAERAAYGVQPGSAVKMSAKEGPVAVGGGNTVINNAINPVLKGLGEQFVEGAATARASADSVRSIQNARSQLDMPGGIYSGAFAENRLALQKLGSFLGVADPSAIQNTETFRTQIKPIVLDTVKGLGAGSGISNADRDFALQAVGGDIKLDEGSIRRVLDITERAARSKIDRHNALADKMLETQPDYRAVAPMLRIEPPEPYAAPGASGPTGSKRLRFDPATGAFR